MSSENTSPLTTCIVGGGNSAHVLIPFLSTLGHRVNLLTRRPTEWGDVISCEITDGDTGKLVEVHTGRLNKKSNDPADVIPEADVIVLCMPVCTYRLSLAKLAPFVNREKDVYIGTIYGQASFNWMVHEIEKEHDLTNITCFAIGSIPWICRTKHYGKSVYNYGGKALNIVAVTPKENFNKLNEIWLEDISLKPLGKGRFVQACSFLSLTMSVDNQIIHPARCYGLWKKSGGVWQTAKDIPYFYRDFDHESAEILRKLDAEYELVRQAIRDRFPELDFTYMLSYLELENLNHTSGQTDILSSLKDSKQLASIKTPTMEGVDGHQYLNTNFRFFRDDIPYGLLIAKSLAQMLQVETPFIDEVIEWAQTLRNEEFIKGGKINIEFCTSSKYLTGIPEVYGVTRIEDCVE